MDPKDIFERQARRPVGPMEPAPKKAGPLDSVHETLFEQLPLPFEDALPRQIEFRRRTESWFSFPYHTLMGMEYLPHSKLILTFSTHTVTVTGRNLEALYKGIRQQTAETVEELDRAAALATPEDQPEIHGIAIAGPAEETSAQSLKQSFAPAAKPSR